MKKRFLIVGLVAVFGFGAFLASCEKERNQCTCVFTEGAETYTEIVFPTNYGLKNCKDLQGRLNGQMEYGSVSCK